MFSKAHRIQAVERRVHILIEQVTLFVQGVLTTCETPNEVRCLQKVRPVGQGCKTPLSEVYSNDLHKEGRRI